MEKQKWQEVIDDTWRLKVEGGYIYHITCSRENPDGGVCYVPDIDLTRYQAHLRDAYKKGYEDGLADSKQTVNRELPPGLV